MSADDSTKILYMEDDPGLARLLQIKLNKSGYQIELAKDGKEGLYKYDNGSYDILVIDYKMPELDGMQVLQALARRGPLPPAILLTGAGNEEIAVEAMKMGAADYIVKDLEGKYFQLLPIVIAETLKRHRFEEEKRLMQNELKRYAAELERSNRELQQFAYVVSHDLKEPLHTVKSFARLLEEDYKEKLELQGADYIESIVAGTERMSRLIDGLLDYSRVEFKKTKLVPVDCNQLILQVIYDLKAVIEKKRARVTHDPLPTVMGAEILLLRLFQNLIDNAIKYCRTRTPRIHINAEKHNGKWQFSVRDNGIGIQEKHREQIFVIFRRLYNHKGYPGTGLGLAICKKIVELHNGNIWVDSEPGKGSTFYFTIPENAKTH